MKKYEELNEVQKEVAREWYPDDYKEYEYKTQGVEIEFACKQEKNN